MTSPTGILRPLLRFERSGYVPGVHLVTPENVNRDGGAKNTYDPVNGYRDQYKRIWGK